MGSRDIKNTVAPVRENRSLSWPHRQRALGRLVRSEFEKDRLDLRVGFALHRRS